MVRRIRCNHGLFSDHVLGDESDLAYDFLTSLGERELHESSHIAVLRIGGSVEVEAAGERVVFGTDGQAIGLEGSGSALGDGDGFGAQDVRQADETDAVGVAGYGIGERLAIFKTFGGIGERSAAENQGLEGVIGSRVVVGGVDVDGFRLAIHLRPVGDLPENISAS